MLAPRQLQISEITCLGHRLRLVFAGDLRSLGLVHEKNRDAEMASAQGIVKSTIMVINNG